MALTATTIHGMGGKAKTGHRPNRRPSVTLYARVDPEIGTAFKEHVDSIRPRTDAQAVIEMLIENYLEQLGKLPPGREPPPSSPGKEPG